MGIFDTHAHYLYEDFGEELRPLLDSLPEKGIERVVAVGYSLESSAEEIALAAEYEYIYAAAGIHPQNASNLPEDWEEKLRELLKKDKVVALGEIGFDYHYEDYDRDKQREVFEKQLMLAKELRLPVIIHSRDAARDTMEMLRKYRPRGVVHCFSGSAETAKEVVALGMYIGFTGVLTFKNAKKAAESCAAVPMDKLLLETDSPYMAPVPHRGEKSNSAMIPYIAQRMAQIKGVSAEEMIDAATENAYKLFFGGRN